jgi:hypothetical protein
VLPIQALLYAGRQESGCRRGTRSIVCETKVHGRSEPWFTPSIREKRNADHHIKGLPFLFDNLVSRETWNTVTVVSGVEVIEDLKKNILNDRIWPDFTRIPTPDAPVLRYAVIRPGRQESIDGYRVTAEKVSHTVPT